jgi:PAS domain-containing protein
MTMLKEGLASQREELESYLEKVSSIGILLIDAARNIQDCNQGFTRMFQLQQKPTGSPAADFLILGDDDLKQTEEMKLSCNHQSGMNGLLCCRTVETENGYLIFCERLILTESRAIEQIGTINNELINLQRETVKKNLLLEKLGRELDERIAEIEATLARVKQLEGIIPICAYCKKIRDDQDDWHGLEKYITEHSEAQFSHGICPACFEKEMKEMGT